MRVRLRGGFTHFSHKPGAKIRSDEALKALVTTVEELKKLQTGQRTTSRSNVSRRSRSWKSWKGPKKSWKTVQVFTTLMSLPEKGEDVVEVGRESLSFSSSDGV